MREKALERFRKQLIQGALKLRWLKLSRQAMQQVKGSRWNETKEIIYVKILSEFHVARTKLSFVNLN